MKNRTLIGALAGGVLLAGASTALLAEGDTKKGAQLFRQCAACHSLESGRHLTGPSLAGLWGRKAGAAVGFGRYSEALKKAELTWDEGTLDAWLKDPKALVPGNQMTFPGIANPEAREHLIAYLKTAASSAQESPDRAQGGGGMGGRSMPDLRNPTATQQVTAIRHCGDAYAVTLGTGQTFTFWEFNLRFKTDSSKGGPPKGKPAIIRAGMMGDRAFVVFSGPEEISRFIEQRC